MLHSAQPLGMRDALGRAARSTLACSSGRAPPAGRGLQPAGARGRKKKEPEPEPEAEAAPVEAAPAEAPAAEAPAAEAPARSPDVAPSAEVLELWRSAKVVCFDVDSTVCLDEGIDDLAEYLGVGEEVKALTARAMGGAVPFQQALEERLELMQPSADDVICFLEEYPARLTPGVEALIAKLHERDVIVFLLSGGFTQMIYPVAAQLDIPDARVVANTLFFHPETGDYLGYDPNSYTCVSGGKSDAIDAIRSVMEEQAIESPIVVVGDGATDAETRTEGASDCFIAFCGVVERPAVVEAADWVVHSFETLTEALQ